MVSERFHRFVRSLFHNATRHPDALLEKMFNRCAESECSHTPSICAGATTVLAWGLTLTRTATATWNASQWVAAASRELLEAAENRQIRGYKFIQDFRFGSSDGTSLHPHPAKRNHFSTRKRRRLRRDRSSPLLAPPGG